MPDAQHIKARLVTTFNMIRLNGEFNIHHSHLVVHLVGDEVYTDLVINTLPLFRKPYLKSEKELNQILAKNNLRIILE